MEIDDISNSEAAVMCSFNAVDDASASTFDKLVKAGITIDEVVQIALARLSLPHLFPDGFIDIDRKIDVLIPDALTARICVMIRDSEAEMLRRIDATENRIMQRIEAMEQLLLSR